MIHQHAGHQLWMDASNSYHQMGSKNRFTTARQDFRVSEQLVDSRAERKGAGNMWLFESIASGYKNTCLAY